METATDTNPADTQTEAAPIEGATETQTAPETQAPAVDAWKSDPKVREHFDKEYSTKYQDYEPSKRAAQELNTIKNDPAFQKWLTERNAPAPAKPFEINDDQFTAALTDKAQFTKLVQEAAQHLLDTKIGPKLQQTDNHFQLQAKTNELHQTIAKFPDFKDLDKRGLIEPILRKYDKITFEDAYWIAKQATFKEDVAAAARGQVTARKGSNVERGNNAPSTNKSVVKVAGRLEAMTKVAEDIAAGREPGNYDYD